MKYKAEVNHLQVHKYSPDAYKSKERFQKDGIPCLKSAKDE